MNLAEKQMDRQGPKLQVKYKKGRRGMEQNEGIRKVGCGKQRGAKAREYRQETWWDAKTEEKEGESNVKGQSKQQDHDNNKNLIEIANNACTYLFGLYIFVYMVCVCVYILYILYIYYI